MRRTLAGRVRWAAVVAACASASVAAVASNAIVGALLLRATDQHLTAGAVQLTRELGRPPSLALDDSALLRERIRDEQEEATSSGITFAVYDRSGAWLGGDPGVPDVTTGCTTRGPLRLCEVSAPGGLSVVAASAHQSEGTLFAFATLAAALVASLVAWLFGTRLARHAVRPLTRLRHRIAELRLHGNGPTSTETLGEPEGVLEIDELRDAMSASLNRVHNALSRATRFAANAAHELRTPLTALRAELELLAEHDGDKATASRAVRKVVQLQALTERLLVLAQPEANVSQHVLISLRDVVDETIAALPAEQRARVVFSGEADVVLHGDEAELGIVVSNGLSNALKFGEHVVVELGSARGRAWLALDDDGPGIDPATCESMFAPFTRGAEARAVPGEGLGLALVAHVARRHGGEARLVASRLHARGARLEIELSLASSS